MKIFVAAPPAFSAVRPSKRSSGPGTPSAAGLAAKADAGEILVADTVRGLCSGKGFLFADCGEFGAKGIEEPVRISEVSWRG